MAHDPIESTGTLCMIPIAGLRAAYLCIKVRKRYGSAGKNSGFSPASNRPAPESPLDLVKVAITQMLAAYAYNSRDFVSCGTSFTEVAEIFRCTGKTEGEATAYHQLGRIAEDQCRLDDAELWFRKSLDIKLTSENHRGRAASYHHLGTIQYERGNYEAAEVFYHESLAISETLNDESVKRVTYHQLGMVADKQAELHCGRGPGTEKH